MVGGGATAVDTIVEGGSAIADDAVVVGGGAIAVDTTVDGGSATADDAVVVGGGASSAAPAVSDVKKVFFCFRNFKKKYIVVLLSVPNRYSFCIFKRLFSFSSLSSDS